MKRILETLRWIAYVFLISVDGIVTVISMASLGHKVEHSVALGIIGAVLILLMTWVFLKGIRAKGIERGIFLGAWLLACVLVVSINWSFARQNLFTQTTTIIESREQEQFEESIRRREIESTQKEIDILIEKLEKVNIWREKDREQINTDIKSAKDRLDELKKPIVKKKETTSSMSIFSKMANLTGLNEEQTADLWWIVAFLILQVFAVLAAPKGEEDEKTIKQRKKRVKIDYVEWVDHWVSANWMAVRTGREGPRKILPEKVFFEYIRNHWRTFPVSIYRTIRRAAQTTETIDDDVIKEENEAEAIKKIMSILTK
jgi:hypothetical protein